MTPDRTTQGDDGPPRIRIYRKRDTVEAVQWFKMGDHPGVILRRQWPEPRDECWVYWIGPLNAGVPVEPGDWLVSSGPGRWFPMKPDKFAATYELAALNTTGGSNDR
jgi:hypothetical protein